MLAILIAADNHRLMGATDPRGDSLAAGVLMID